MMRINQFSNASMFQSQSARMQGNTRVSGQDFRTSLQNNSQSVQGMQTGNNQPQQPQQIAGQQNNIQPTAPEGFSGFSGVVNMPGGQMPSEMPAMPDGEMPEMPSMPDGEMPEMPSMPDGEMPEMPSMPDGEMPEMPSMPDGEEPPAKPDGEEGVDGEMGMPPSGMPGGFSGMQRPGGSFIGMNGMNSFNAMSFAMNMRQA